MLERIDDLMTNDLKIIQSQDTFRFSMDAVLLARFCTVPAKGHILDLCSGNGVIPLLLSTRTKATITGVEIQSKLVELARKSIALNQLGSQIKMIHQDLKQFKGDGSRDHYDLVTVNPPYLPSKRGDTNLNPYVAAARHEIFCSLEDVVAACARVTKTGSKVAMIHRPSRLVDIICLMRQYKIEPKRVRFVHPKQGNEANMVLVEGIKDGKPELRLLPPLIVYNDNDTYRPELLKLYYGENEGKSLEYTTKLSDNRTK